MTTARATDTETTMLPNTTDPATPLAFGSTAGLGPLVEKLRSTASAGYDEWRVQDPKDGAYCMAYSWCDSHHPEREARAWLADQQQRGRYADYVVACVRVVPQKDRLLAEAAEALAQLGRELEAQRLYARALCKAVDAATDFAGTVAGGASWWDDVWTDHAAALDRARDRISAASEGPDAKLTGPQREDRHE